MLIDAMERGSEMAVSGAMVEIRGKIVTIRLPGSSVPGVCALENLACIASAFQTNPEELMTVDSVSGLTPGGNPFFIFAPVEETFGISVGGQDLVGTGSPHAGINDWSGSSSP